MPENKQAQIYSSVAINQSNNAIKDDAKIWIFGYGSLIFKVDFDYLQQKEAYLQGWQRRFWMASQDHRGTPDKPGRVLTIHQVEDTRCYGMAYLITGKTLRAIDVREQNGYIRHNLSITTKTGEVLQAITYIGDPKSPVYVEETSTLKLAKHIAISKGPSGLNAEYVFELANALRHVDEYDEHVFSIESHLQRLIKQG